MVKLPRWLEYKSVIQFVFSLLQVKTGKRALLLDSNISRLEERKQEASKILPEVIIITPNSFFWGACVSLDASRET